MSRAIVSAILILTCLLSSCGYRFGEPSNLVSGRSVALPYIDGDQEGVLTGMLARALVERGVCITDCDADLTLCVCLFSPRDENIGFTYAVRKGVRQKFTVANEARLSVVAKVSIVDSCTGDTLYGPVKVHEWVDYDFEPDLSSFDFHAKSLGQLEVHNLATQAAYRPLYEKLAQNLADRIRYCPPCV